MQNAIQGLKRSVSIKAAIIGGLVLVLLIPVSMINGVVHDRESVHQQARWDIMRAWGQPQLLAGPVLIVPYTLRHVDSKGNEYIEDRHPFQSSWRRQWHLPAWWRPGPCWQTLTTNSAKRGALGCCCSHASRSRSTPGQVRLPRRVRW